MAHEELTIKFEGYEDNTATYVVVTNDNQEIEDVVPADRYVETEEIELLPRYEDDLIVETLEPSTVEHMQLVPAPSSEFIHAERDFQFE